MMPIYSKYRVACLFFIAYLIFGLFFLMNLVLAVVYNSFEMQDAEKDKLEADQRLRSLNTAFDVLDFRKTGSIDFGTFRELLDELQRNGYSFKYQRPRLKDYALNAMFAYLDSDGNEKLDIEEFNTLISAMGKTIEGLPEINTLKEWFPSLYAMRLVHVLDGVVRSSRFELVMDGILLCNMSGSIYETLDPNTNPIFEAVDLVVSIIFVVEVILKVILLGPITYWSSNANKFDCVTSCVALTVGVYAWVPNDFGNRDVIRYALVVRLLRFSRVFLHVERFAVVCGTFVSMVSSSGPLLALQFAAMYCFSVMGCQLYGGLIRFDDPDLEASDFGQAGYYPNNFNDGFSAMVTLFELMIVNNWLLNCLCARISFLHFCAFGFSHSHL
jgi:two pore calcium channel protein